MTQTVDVNEAFAETRRADMARIQGALADGSLRDNGDGTGTWMSGYDQGEKIQLKDGMPITELDMTLGTAALYTRVPAWHDLGNVVPEGVVDIDEVMKLGGIDWQVEKRVALFPTVAGGMKKMAGRFVVVRNDVEVGLGTVGKVYEPLQNRESFEFLQDVMSDFGIVWESAGALREGTSTFVSMKLPNDVEIDLPPTALLSKDVVKQFVVALNSHDGSGSFRLLITPWRPLCGNTERFALRDAKTSFSMRHTKNVREKIAMARQALKLSGRYFEQFAREEQALADAEFTMAEFAKMTEELWARPDDEASARTTNTWQTRRDKLIGMWDEEAEQLGKTRYTAERVMTRWFDNERPVRIAAGTRGAAYRATMVLEQADDQKKNRVHKLLLQTR